MSYKKPKNLQGILDNLSPYLISIEIDFKNDFLPILVLQFPKEWSISEENDDFSVYFDVPYSKFYIGIKNSNLILDDLYEFVYSIILENNKRIEKQKKLDAVIQKEKEKFEKRIKELTSEILEENDSKIISQIPVVEEMIVNNPINVKLDDLKVDFSDFRDDSIKNEE